MSDKIKVEYADGTTGELSVPSGPPDRSAFDAVMSMFGALGAFDVIREEEE
jgi:hypothetical protein